MKQQFIRTIKLDGTVDVTDPCYSKDTWCRTTLDCKPGKYNCYVEKNDEGIILKAAIVLNGVEYDSNELEKVDIVIGVDSGLCGFFDNKPDYDYDDGTWYKVCNWFEICRTCYNGTVLERTYLLADCESFVVSSGYGDGGYELYVKKEDNQAVVLELRF